MPLLSIVELVEPTVGPTSRQLQTVCVIFWAGESDSSYNNKCYQQVPGTSRKISSCAKVRTPNPYILLEPDTTMISVAHFTVLPFDWRA
jgi:hypothetical protein